MTWWTAAHQAPLPVEFSRQEYWGGLPFPSPGNLPEPGVKPRSPTLRQILYHWATREAPRSRQFCEKWEDEEIAEEKYEDNRGCFMRFKERNHLHNIKVQGEIASTNIEVAASCPQDQVKIIKESGFTTTDFQQRQNSLLMEEDAIWKC